MPYFVFEVYLHTEEGYEIPDMVAVEANTLEEAERRLLEEFKMSRYSVRNLYTASEAKSAEKYGYKLIKKEV